MTNEKYLVDINVILSNNVWFCGGYVGDKYSEGYMDALDEVETVIRNTPKVDAVEVVHGEWVYDHWCEFRCSICGEWSNSEPYKGKENYCPNCGAKMDGGKYNEEY